MYVHKYVVMYVRKYVVMYVHKYVVVMYMYVHKYVVMYVCKFSQVVAAPGSSDIPGCTIVECSLIPRCEMYTHGEPGIFSHMIMM